ncbi:MAG: hypothetical protein JSS30_03425 [Verrucomicrobia bacterium]|nr:hypothetical protein [Verrucomicrobiota bacterium]
MESTGVNTGPNQQSYYSNHNNEVPRQPAGNNQPAGQLPRSMIMNLREGMAGAQRARGQQIVALVGPTGTGKSVIANDLMQRRIVKVRVNNESVLEVDPTGLNESERANIAPIGHGGTSRTHYTRVYPIPGNPGKSVADCGGFYDTRGLGTEVVVVSSMKHTIDAAQSAKLILCCEHSLMNSSRGVFMTNMLRDIFTGALRADSLPNSIVLAITKPVRLFGEDPPTTQDIIDKFRTLLADTEKSDNPDYHLIEVLKFILREDGRYILLYDPTNPQSREQLNDRLATLDPLPRNIFRPAYSAGASLAIFNTIMAISARGLQLFRSYSMNNDRIDALNITLNQLTARRNQYTQLVAQLNGGANANPGQIREQKEAIKETNRLTIEQANNRLEAINVRVEALRNRINTAETEKNAMDNRDNEEKRVYHYHFEEEPKYVEVDKSTPGHTEYKFVLGPFKFGKKKKPAEKKIEQVPLENEYRFTYQGGIPIRRIEKTPQAGATCWSSAVGGVEENRFEETYRTEPGEAGNAEVQIFVRRRDWPSAINKKNLKLVELQTLRTEVSELQSEITDRNREISTAQQQNANLDNQLNNLAHYQEELSQIETAISEAEQNRSQRNQQKTDFEREIDSLEPELSFLREYRDLTGDQRLNRPEIDDVIVRHHIYREGHPL